jgi:hypothetical protein
MAYNPLLMKKKSHRVKNPNGPVMFCIGSHHIVIDGDKIPKGRPSIKELSTLLRHIAATVPISDKKPTTVKIGPKTISEDFLKLRNWKLSNGMADFIDYDIRVYLNEAQRRKVGHMIPSYFIEIEQTCPTDKLEAADPPTHEIATAIFDALYKKLQSCTILHQVQYRFFTKRHDSLDEFVRRDVEFLQSLTPPWKMVSQPGGDEDDEDDGCYYWLKCGELEIDSGMRDGWQIFKTIKDDDNDLSGPEDTFIRYGSMSIEVLEAAKRDAILKAEKYEAETPARKAKLKEDLLKVNKRVASATQKIMGGDLDLQEILKQTTKPRLMRLEAILKKNHLNKLTGIKLTFDGTQFSIETLKLARIIRDLKLEPYTISRETVAQIANDLLTYPPLLPFVSDRH